MNEALIPQMVNLKRLAPRRHCRVKTWRITEDQAIQIASEMVHSKCTPAEIVQIFKAGNACLLGARVIVR